MGLTSLQAWMDPTDWLQGAMSDDGGIDSSSPSSVDMLACSRPLMERRLRPPHDQALNCPRCDSTNTKFCYYNNYSLTQPRYFCKTCRRYWTKGGTLRNIPVGGGCRKNKKSSSSSSSTSKKPLSVDTHHNNSDTASIGHNNHHMPNNPTDLQLSFPQVQLSGLIGTHGGVLSTSFLDNKYNALLDRPNSVGFLEGKFDALVAHSATRGHHDLLGSTNINGVDFGLVGGGGGGGIGLMDHHLGGGLSHHNYHVGLASTSSNLFANTLSSSSPFGAAVEGNSSSGHVFETAYQRLMLPCDFSQMNSNEHGHQNGFVDVKPGSKLLSLEWQGNNGTGAENKDSFGYNNGGVNGLSSWGGSMLNGYTPSTTNSFI